MKKIIIYLLIVTFLSSCWSNKVIWTCTEDWTVMYSKDQNWNLWSADKWCSCEQIKDFEMRTFWEVDYDALKSDFWCE